jgi:hypothetical protein
MADTDDECPEGDFKLTVHTLVDGYKRCKCGHLLCAWLIEGEYPVGKSGRPEKPTTTYCSWECWHRADPERCAAAATALAELFAEPFDA